MGGKENGGGREAVVFKSVSKLKDTMTPLPSPALELQCNKAFV